LLAAFFLPFRRIPNCLRTFRHFCVLIFLGFCEDKRKNELVNDHRNSINIDDNVGIPQMIETTASYIRDSDTLVYLKKY
jgi:hypothetical protein